MSAVPSLDDSSDDFTTAPYTGSSRHILPSAPKPEKLQRKKKNPVINDPNLELAVALSASLARGKEVILPGALDFKSKSRKKRVPLAKTPLEVRTSDERDRIIALKVSEILDEETRKECNPLRSLYPPLRKACLKTGRLSSARDKESSLWRASAQKSKDSSCYYVDSVLRLEESSCTKLKSKDGNSSPVLSLSKAYISLINESHGSDVSIYAKDEKEIKTHSIIFFARFPKILKDSVIDGEKRIIIWSDVDFHTAMVFLRFVYGGLLPENLSTRSEFLGLSLLSKKYHVDDLVTFLKNVNSPLIDDSDVICDDPPQAQSVTQNINDLIDLLEEDDLESEHSKEEENIFERDYDEIREYILTQNQKSMNEARRPSKKIPVEGEEENKKNMTEVRSAFKEISKVGEEDDQEIINEIRSPPKEGYQIRKEMEDDALVISLNDSDALEKNGEEYIFTSPDLENVVGPYESQKNDNKEIDKLHEDEWIEEKALTPPSMVYCSTQKEASDCQTEPEEMNETFVDLTQDSNDKISLENKSIRSPSPDIFADDEDISFSETNRNQKRVCPISSQKNKKRCRTISLSSPLSSPKIDFQSISPEPDDSIPTPVKITPDKCSASENEEKEKFTDFDSHSTPRINAQFSISANFTENLSTAAVFDSKPRKNVPSHISVTPMPDYESMLSPDLRAELKKFGLKVVPKSKACRLLKYVYDGTHHTSSQEGEEQNKDVDDETPRSSQISLDSSFSDLAEESICFKHDESEGVDDEIAKEIESQGGASSLNEKLMDFIRSDHLLWKKVLLYEPIWLEEFASNFKASPKGIKKCKINEIINFLDSESITFRTQKSMSRNTGKKSKK